jgi:hypothetical protein
MTSRHGLLGPYTFVKNREKGLEREMGFEPHPSPDTQRSPAPHRRGHAPQSLPAKGAHPFGKPLVMVSYP